MVLSKIIIGLAILGIFSLGVSADTMAVENGAVFGQGAIPCKKFLKASKSKKNEYVIWIQGYITAYNAIAPDVSNILEGRSFFWVLEQLERLCKTMPEDYFNEAAVHLVGELHPQGIRIAPPSDKKGPLGAELLKKP